MELKINGKLKQLMDLQSWDSGFSKREFVITTNEQYPQDIKLECIKDKTSLLNGINPGEDVEVSFNLRGNEFNGKFYVNLQAWKIIKDNEGPQNTPPPDTDFEPLGEDDEDLPF